VLLVPTESEHLSRHNDELRAGIQRNMGSIPGRGKIFSLFHSVQTGSGAHPVFFPMGTVNLYQSAKRSRRESDYSHPSSAGVKNDGTIPSLPHSSHAVMLN
jgi:hypothetical protein